MSGDSSRLEWFNQLATDPNLSSAKQNHFWKINHIHVANDCIFVKGFTEDTRPVLDKSTLKIVRGRVTSAPARYSPYHIALINPAQLVPVTEPPAYPRNQQNRTSWLPVTLHKSPTRRVRVSVAV
ncbi:hypothetical protein V1527DRAFT_316938 [Lipomyces starkeyi]